MNKDNDILFEQYFKNQLNTKDKADIEARLNSDEDFNIEFEDFKKVKEVADLFQRREIRAKVEGIYKASYDKKPKINRRVVLFAGIAASIVILAIFWLRPLNMVEESKGYFTPYPDRITVMGDNTGDISIAIGHYNAQRYHNAIAEFNKISTSEAHFYSAISSLAIGNPQQASDGLQQFVSAPESHFYEASLWYMSLALLQEDNAKLAQVYLMKITNDSNILYHQKDALELLEKLK
ncbi:MAG: hypothetical protein COA58_13300 [Bacteroidetes bacterium]|nr:MAG: hypothetical protein COA58_13300 [Bacteroidota bacterium]